MRKPLIAGNWKMNKTCSEAVGLVEELKRAGGAQGVEVVVCPPFTALKDVANTLQGCDIKLGAQNMHFEESGAFTGEVSPLMLKELGVDYVIIGHSERRHIFEETDTAINKKVRKALQTGIVPILCVGETLEEREMGKTEEVVKRQTVKALEGLQSDAIPGTVVAYEPVWAIGTGRSATAEEANRVIGYIRGVIDSLADGKGDGIRILYGGSVNRENAAQLLSQPQVDGALVGGASLKAGDFYSIIREAM